MLTIISLFCDKDYQYIPSLLNNFNEKVTCDSEFILVDNREENKNIPIPEIDIFFNTHKGKVLTNGKNLGILLAKKLAVENANGEYIWFIDDDDWIYETISPLLLSECKGDLIAFNLWYAEGHLKRLYRGNHVLNKRFIVDKNIFKNKNYLNTILPTTWNKWYKRSIIKDIYSQIKEDIWITCNEDFFLNLNTLNNISSVQEIPLNIYVNDVSRAISNGEIKNINNFHLLLKGYNDSLKLLNSCNLPSSLYNASEKIEYDIKFYLGRVTMSDTTLWDSELDTLINVFPHNILQKVAEYLTVDFFIEKGIKINPNNFPMVRILLFKRLCLKK